MTEESRISNLQKSLNSISHILTLSPDRPDASSIGERSRRQIEQWLSAEARLLIDKKDRYQQKQDRLKELEEQYEASRSKKQREIEQKLVASEHLKNKNIEGVQKKLLGVSTRHRSVFSRHQEDEEKEIDRLYHQRIAFETDNPRPSSKLSHSSSRSSNSHPKLPPFHPKDQEIQKRIKEINLRIQKANSVNKERKLMVLDRIRGHNTTELQKAQQKAKQQLLNQVSTFEHKITKQMVKSDHLMVEHSRSAQKKQQERLRAYTFKLRAYQDNLRNLENQQSNKVEQLNRKFEQSRSGSKVWRNERGELYQRKFMANLSLLQQQKIQKADSILQKHQEITAKNKVYRERKDSLFKAIKCQPPSAKGYPSP